jgi:hypothetical protein
MVKINRGYPTIKYTINSVKDHTEKLLSMDQNCKCLTLWEAESAIPDPPEF